MADRYDADNVREIVLRTLKELRLASVPPREEAILLRAGYYAGHRYEFEGVHAIWMRDVDQVAFYGPQGQVLKVVELPPASRANRAA
jgi:hypothetical protein